MRSFADPFLSMMTLPNVLTELGLNVCCPEYRLAS
jgi:hypothetical protein